MTGKCLPEERAKGQRLVVLGKVKEKANPPLI
jgi:hypothetical protein